LIGIPSPRGETGSSSERQINELLMTHKPELLLNDLKIALRSLGRSKGLAVTVMLTLALASAPTPPFLPLCAACSFVRSSTATRAASSISAKAHQGSARITLAFSVPEIQDLRASVKTLTAFGDFFHHRFTMVGLGEPREVRAGVVGGSYFEVMGLHPVLGRLLDMRDDGPNAAGAAVVTIDSGRPL